MGKISTLFVIALYLALAPLYGNRPFDSLARHTLVEQLAARQATTHTLQAAVGGSRMDPGARLRTAVLLVAPLH